MSVGPLLVLLTCLVASVSYIGAVTQSALATMVLPMVVVVGALAAWMRRRPLPAVWTAVLVSGLGGESVNVLSGDYQGSVARSAGVASLATGLAVVLSATRRPALFLAPVAAIVAWALALGAGGRVELVAVLTAALALVALAAVERDLRAFVAAPRLGLSVPLALLLLVAGGVFAALFQLHHDSRPAASPFRETLARTIEPPAILSMTRHPPPSATRAVPVPPHSSVTATPHPSRLRPVLSNLLWAVLALLAALAAGGLARLVWVAFAWRLLYRRLVRRTSETEASAWLWMLAALGRTGARMPAHRSPDQVATGDLSGLHDALHEPVQALAGSVTLAVFGAPGVTPVDTNAWLLARKASDAAWSSVGRAGRLRARFRAPGAENRLDRGSKATPRPMTSRSS